MKKSNGNQTVTFAVLGLGLLFLFKDKLFGSSTSDGKYFNVPGVGPVKETELGNYGYSFVYGRWLTQQQFQRVLEEYSQNTGNQNGTPNQIANWISQVGPAVLGIIQAIGGATGGGGDPFTGGGNGNGGYYV